LVNWRNENKEAFQKKYDLKQTGIFTLETRDLMQEKLDNKGTENTVPIVPPTGGAVIPVPGVR